MATPQEDHLRTFTENLTSLCVLPQRRQDRSPNIRYLEASEEVHSDCEDCPLTDIARYVDATV
jgi:hypothetical protein